MKLHFNFNLARFRYNRISIRSEVEAFVYGFSADSTFEVSIFTLYGEEKISAFTREISSKLNSENPDIFILHIGTNPIAVSLIPSNCPKNIKSVNMEKLDYLLINEETKHMNGLMNLETLDAYMFYLTSSSLH